MKPTMTRRARSSGDAAPTFSDKDCALLTRYATKPKLFNEVPGEDASAFRDLRTRLTALVDLAASKYGGKVQMKPFTSILNPSGRTAKVLWACIYPQQSEGQQTNKSFSLQLALILLPDGAELSFCLGAGRADLKDEAEKGRNEQELEAVRAGLKSLRAEIMWSLEPSLRSTWHLRKKWFLRPEPVQDFTSILHWLAFAAADKGAGASISRYFSTSDIAANGDALVEAFFAASALFQPIFESVYLLSEPSSEPQPEALTRIREIEPPTATPVVPFARLDLRAIHADFAAALRESNLSFGADHDEFVRAFLASLATKRFLILTGLSGSGKTQIAMRFGEWMGDRRWRVIPVRPDWTGAEALFGYEDALLPMREGVRAWSVPNPLEFMLCAAADPDSPYLMILDEMNLAHVERYFADFLSGMETGQSCLPNLTKDDDGCWRPAREGESRIPIPSNLFVVGTVNIDETTYLFSPKVLDRANTIEFRVRTDDLQPTYRKPGPCRPGPSDLVQGFSAISVDDDWHLELPAPGAGAFAERMRQIHTILAADGFEFGHRVFYEATRFAAMLAAAGDAEPDHALDRQILQKILPRLHGSRRRLEATLCALALECVGPDGSSRSVDDKAPFDPMKPLPSPPSLPLSFEKIRRMVRSVRANQFTSFTE
jgi:hypothetical protein